jgi:hypothetical protein
MKLEMLEMYKVLPKRYKQEEVTDRISTSILSKLE